MQGRQTHSLYTTNNSHDSQDTPIKYFEINFKVTLTVELKLVKSKHRSESTSSSNQFFLRNTSEYDDMRNKTIKKNCYFQQFCGNKI